MPTKHMVIKASPRKFDSLQVGEKSLNFGDKTQAMEVNDAGLARDIEAQYGPKGTGDVVLVHHQHQEPGHRSSFLVPELPWKKGQQ